MCREGKFLGGIFHNNGELHEFLSIVEESIMTKKLKKRLQKIILGTVLFIIAIVCNSIIPFVAETVLGLILFLIAYFVIGG